MTEATGDNRDEKAVVKNVVQRRNRPAHRLCSFNFELWTGELRNMAGGLCACRAGDWMVYGYRKRV